MSSSEGLERLKNWQSASKALVTPSVSWKGSIRLSEVRVRVAFVDSATLVLVNLDAPGETATLDLRGATFAASEETDLELTFPDGKRVYLREE